MCAQQLGFERPVISDIHQAHTSTIPPVKIYIQSRYQPFRLLVLTTGMHGA